MPADFNAREHHDHERLWAQEPGYRLATAQRDRFRDLVERALSMVAFAVDVPRQELEAQEWLCEAQEALDA